MGLLNHTIREYVELDGIHEDHQVQLLFCTGISPRITPRAQEYCPNAWTPFRLGAVTTPLCLTCEPVAHQSQDMFIQLCAGYFVQKDSVRHGTESFAEIQKHPINRLPLITGWDTLAQKKSGLTSRMFPLMKLCWPWPALFFRCFSILHRTIFSITLPDTEVKLIGLWFPGSSFLLFLKTRTLASFQSAGIFLDSKTTAKSLREVFWWN